MAVVGAKIVAIENEYRAVPSRGAVPKSITQYSHHSSSSRAQMILEFLFAGKTGY